ncbi:hypothetical protein ACRQ1B_06075 [Rhizobium panacihumi]|uniref:hypothetical protein n=1 Tax=Rhizobium panacihumi TaxID=2008450 RepID=UPI003D78F235
MVSRPGRMQSAFTAGELGEYLFDRTQLKYFSTGLQHAENVAIIPQGGFRVRDGLRHVGDLPANASKILPFHASTGAAYDLVFSGEVCQIWTASAITATIVIPGLSPVVDEMTEAQQSDTMLLFHENLRSKRIRATDAGWVVDDLPFENIPNYDYGGDYTNGVPARWRLEFVGLEAFTSIFVVTVSGQETKALTYVATMPDLADAIRAAVEELANVSPGIEVTSPSDKVIEILFTGDGNEGDGWAVSGRVINKADAAITASKRVPGVMPGEPVMSPTRGWPQCGVFWQQRLLVGGLRSLPNAWLMSLQGDYFNYDLRFTEANGPAIIPMDKAGGERIERMVASLNLLIFTTQAEYWIAERALSKVEAPNHVQASRNGIKRGVPVIENEGAAIWCHANGSTIGELRYTDVEGNFVAIDTSLLASHLLEDVVDQASRRSSASMDGNLQAIIRKDGQARLVTLLREQEVTAYSRFSADGLFKATARNARNELSFVIENAGTRSLQRLEPGLLLDEAIDIVSGAPTTVVPGLARFNGRQVWVIGDRDVFGPYVVTGGAITLPIAVTKTTVGTWRPPIVSTLSPPRDIGPNTVLKRKARIHTVHVSIVDTTSLAIGTNGGAMREVNLHRYGVLADVGELDQGVTGEIKITGLRGYAVAPFITISQLRPGRLNVRSITVETAL